MNKPGAYSLIQFYPDLSRAEGVNVGVLVLLEGEAPAVRVLSRTKELSGRVGAADARYALFAAASVARRLVSLGGPVTQEQLVEWVSREGGPIHFTPLRSVVVEALEQTVEDLFARLVEVGGGRGAARRLAAPDLEPAFSPLVAAAKVVRDPPVIVPVTGKRIRVPFAYLNGEYHMVKPQAFTRTMDAALASASHLGVQGRLLREHVRVEGRRLKLTVVGSFSSTSVRGAVEDLLGQFETRLVDEEHLPEFVEEVETTAHVVEPPSTLALSAPDVPAVVSKAHVLSRSRPKALPPPKKH